MKDKNGARILSVLSTLIIVGLAVFLATSAKVQAAAGINSQLSFEGKIVKSDGTNISDGTYNMEFKIYQDGNSSGSGSTLKWTEDWLVGGSGGVALTNGTFQVNLGAHNAFGSQVDWNQDTLWLSLQIGNSSSCTISTNFHTDCSGDGEMTPYVRLTAVPYALNSNALSGLSASNFVQLAQSLQTDSTTTNGSIAINKTGASGDILLLEANNKKALEVNNSGTTLIGQAGASGLNGTLTFNNGSGTNTVSLSLQANPGSSYALLLPTTAPSVSQCLQTDGSVSSQLVFSACSTGSGVTGVAYSTSSNASGASIASNTLTIYKANGSNPGFLSADAQTIGGDKTLQGLLILQPASSLTSGQVALQQTFTNGSSTGGTVTGQSQTITISNTSSASTTNGINIALSDATSLANTDRGLYVDLSGIANTTATRIAAGFNGGSVLQTAASPLYTGGADSTGSGTGTDSDNVVVTSGRYTYVAKVGNSGTCSASDSTGCELQIYDNSNPANPSYVGGAQTRTGVGDSVFGLAVSGRYAYVGKIGLSGTCSSSTRDGCELQIYDISNPSSPTFVGGADNGGDTVRGLAVSGRYLYEVKDADAGTCSSSTRDGCELQIYDISNPSSPVYVNGFNIGLGATAVATTGNYTYVTINGNGGTCSSVVSTGCELQVYNTSIPFSASYVGGADSINAGNGVNTFFDLSLSGRYAYIGKAGNGGTCSAATRDGCELQIYDISNPTSPIFVGGSDTTEAGTNSIGVLSLTVAGKYAYIGKIGSNGSCIIGTRDGCEIQVYDVSTPSSPSYVGGSDSTNAGTGLNNFNSVTVSGRYAYIAKASNGGTCSSTDRTGCELQVYDISGVEATSVVAGSLAAGALQVQDNAQFNSQLGIAGGLSVGQTAQISGDLGVSGLVALQPGSSLTSGQNGVTQTLTNASSTGGTVQGYSQTITVNNSSSVSTTNGLAISLTDATALGNNDTGIDITVQGNGSNNKVLKGINITVNGSDTSNGGYGVFSSVNRGIGLYGKSTAAAGSNVECGSFNTTYSIGVCGSSNLASSSGFGGIFVAGGNSATALLATNYQGTGNIFQLQDGTNSINVMTVADEGLITLQPDSNLTSGQTNISQTLTNGSSTGGTVQGYNQTITVSNTSSASTTNGINIGITDATTLANTTNGVNATVTDNGASGAKTNKAVTGTVGGSNANAINYGGYFALSGGASTSAALFATNGTSTGNIFQLQDGTSPTNVLTVADGGLITIQPAASLTSGQTNISQTLTNGSSTGGTVQGYSQTITVSNTSTASTTKGFSVTLTDATTLSNTDVGLSLDLSSISNTAAAKTALSAVGGSIIQTPVNPTYQGGSDSTTGAGSDTTNQVVVYGKYEYVAKAANGGTCSATVATGCELQIFDVSNPASPTYVGGADSINAGTGSVDSFLAVSVAGHYAYVGKSGDSGTCNASTRDGCELMVFDISNPSSPAYVGGIGSPSNVNNTTVFASGHYVYVGNTTNGLLFEYDVSNATNPINLGSSGSIGTDSAQGIYVSGRYAYITKAGDSGTCSIGVALTGCELVIIDLSNPASLTSVGVIDSVNAGNGTNSFKSVYVSGRYLYVTQSTGSSATCSSATRDGCELQIYDVSNPASPAYVGGADSTTGAGTDGFNSVFVSGKYAYVGKVGDNGTCSSTVSTGCELQIYDVSNPASPVYKGGVDSTIGAGTDAFNSVYVSGRYIYVGKAGNGGTCSSSVPTGCEDQVYDLTGVEATTLTGGSVYAGTLAVGTSGQVAGDFNIQGAATVGQSVQVAGSISTGSGLVIASTGNTGNVTLSLGSTTSSISLTLPTALPGASNYCIVSTNLGVLSFSACGASSTGKVTLTPEYPGAVLTGDGANNSGTMTSDFCSGSSLRNIPSTSNPCAASEEHNFYTWVTTAQNDYDIWIRWQVPQDFADFAASNAVQMYGWRTDSTATTEVDLSLYNSSGTICGSTTSVATGTATWTQTSLSGTVTAAGCSISAGNVVDLRIQMVANNKTVRAGEITINYTRN